jgi:hypothetical protein
METNRITGLKENYIRERIEGETLSFREWVEREVEYDPGFLRWFFNDENISDFGGGMTTEQAEAWAEFQSTLGTNEHKNYLLSKIDFKKCVSGTSKNTIIF